MTAYTSILVRYDRGYLYVGDPHGAREMFIKLDTDDRKAAIDFAKRYLKIYENNRETVALDGRVLAAGHIPGDGYQLGDTMGGNKLVGYAAALSDEAFADITPQLNDPLEDRKAAMERLAARLGRGARSENATPDITRQEQGTGTDTSPPPFSLGQEIYKTISPWWVCTRPYWCTWVEVTLETAGETTSRIDLQWNGNTVRSVLMAPGQHRRVMRVARGWLPGEVMTQEIKVAGRRAAKLAVVPKGTMI